MPAPRPLQARRLLGVPVRLDCDDPELAARLERCYERFPPSAEEPAEEPADPLEAVLEAEGSGWRVRVAGRAPRRVDDPVAAVRTFNHELLHGVMLRTPELYFVHAGVVAVGGRAVVLPGLSQAGKSTLVLALLEEGARLLSDELLAYDPRTRTAHAFPRAIKIRDTCAPYFPGLSEAFEGSGEGRFLSFSALRSDVVQEEAPIGAIVVPRWAGARGRLELEPITSGRALLELAGSSLNFGTHRVRSLDCLAALADGTRAWRLAWASPREAARGLLAALEESEG